MDTKIMCTYAPLLPLPGETVVCECLDEIERLKNIFLAMHAAIKDHKTDDQIFKQIQAIVSVVVRT